MQEHQHRGSEHRGGEHRGRGRGWGGEHRGGGGGREGRWGGPRMRRGQIRTAILAVLTEGPGHGYDVMQNLEDKTGGAWRPSPGSVYPTLQLLEDEGLAGKCPKRNREVRDAFAQLFRAFKQIAEVGTPEQVERGLVIVNDARKQL